MKNKVRTISKNREKRDANSFIVIQNIAAFCIVILFHAQVNAPNTWSGIHVIFL